MQQLHLPAVDHQAPDSAWYFRQKPVDVAHFSAGPGFLLAVVMQERPGITRDLRPSQDIVADQIDHLGTLRLELRRAQRPACDSSDVLLKL